MAAAISARAQNPTYQVVWPVPAGAQTGTYTTKIGVCSGNWATLYHWNDQAVALVVTGAVASPTPAITVTPAAASGKHFGVNVAGAGFGVNVAGAGFGESRLPGALNEDYLYTAESNRQSDFAGKGQMLVAIPFRWERVQTSAYGQRSAADIRGLHSML